MNDIKIGDKLVSETHGYGPVTVTGFTKTGDYITDERDLTDIFEYYYVIRKENAKRVT